MAAGERTLRVKVDGESRGLEAMARRSATAVGDFDRRVVGAGKSAAKSEKDVDRLNKRMGGIGSTATLAAVGIGAAAAAWIAATGAALQEIERLRAQTDTVVRSMGAVWTDTGQIVAYAENIEKLTGIEMEQVQAGQNLLLTYGNITNRVGEGNNVFDQATSLMVDLSVATGKAMPEAANLLGKALNNPIKGVTALTRVGVQFTEAQKTQIKTLVETGDVMGAQKIILEELTKQFGGSAEAFGETTAGKVAKLQNEFGNLSEELLAGVLPALNGLVSIASDVVHWFQENQGLVKTLAVALGGLAVTYLAVHGAIRIVNGATAAWNALSKLALGGTIGLGAGFAGLSAAARVASLSMGAIGIVATIIGTAMSLFGGQSAEAAARQEGLKAAAQDLNDVLLEQKGIINDTVREKAIQIARDNDLLTLAKQAKVPTEVLIDALLGEADAVKFINDRVEEYRNNPGMASKHFEEFKALTNLNTSVDRFSTELAGAAEASDLERLANQENMSVREQILALIDQQVTALEELVSAQREAAGEALSLSEAEIAWQETLDQASASARENGATHDLLTEKGRANQSALNDLAKSTFDLIDAQVKNGASGAQLATTMGNARTSFIQLATQMGYTQTEAEDLANRLGLIPGNYKANVDANTTNAVRKLKELERMLADLARRRNIDVGAAGSGIFGGKATGGPVLAGQSYVVGERGPEIFKAPNSGTIIPNHMLTGGGDVAVYVTIDGQQLQGRIDRTVRENNRGIRRGVGAGTGRSR